MKINSINIASTVLYIGLFVAAIFGTSFRAEAATLPTACASTPVISTFTPYVYDGVLNSFDYTASGGESVSVVSTMVGGRALESNFVTIWRTAQPNAKKVHVDVPSWYGFSGETKIAVKIMTATSSNCAAEKEFVVQLGGVAKAPAKPATTTISHETSTSGETVTDKDSVPTDGTGVVAAPVSGETGKGGACTSWPSSTWILLIIVCIAAVFVIIDSLPYLLAGNGIRFAVVLLAMFLIMLGMWFLFDQCRQFRWFPIAVTLLTLGTLIMPTTLEGRKGKTRKLPF